MDYNLEYMKKITSDFETRWQFIRFRFAVFETKAVLLKIEMWFAISRRVIMHFKDEDFIWKAILANESRLAIQQNPIVQKAANEERNFKVISK